MLTVSDGRKDDIIVFANGQKWNPVPSETMILSKTDAIGVVVTGSGQSEPAVLIELRSTNKDTKALLDQVWPVIQEANSQTARYGRINRSKVGFVEPGTFTRTPKGTVVRKITLQNLQSQVDRLYQDCADKQTNGHSQEVIHQTGTAQDPLSVIRESVHQIASVKGISDTDDMFIHGLDSIEAAEIAHRKGLWDLFIVCGPLAK